MSSRGCLLWDVIVYGSVYGVFQVVPVVFKWSGVGVGLKKTCLCRSSCLV